MYYGYYIFISINNNNILIIHINTCTNNSINSVLII